MYTWEFQNNALWDINKHALLLLTVPKLQWLHYTFVSLSISAVSPCPFSRGVRDVSISRSLKLAVFCCCCCRTLLSLLFISSLFKSLVEELLSSSIIEGTRLGRLLYAPPPLVLPRLRGKDEALGTVPLHDVALFGGVWAGVGLGGGGELSPSNQYVVTRPLPWNQRLL